VPLQPDLPSLSAVGSGTFETSALVQHLTSAINSTLDLHSVLQTVTDIATTLSGATLSAFFYHDTDARRGTGGADLLRVISGADPASFSALRSSWLAPVLDRTLAGGATVRVDDVSQDARVSGRPRGPLPVRSYLATPVVGRAGEVIGALVFGHTEPAMFTQRSEDAVTLVGGHAAVAVENARLYTAQSEALALAEERALSLQLLQEVTSRLAGIFTIDDAIDALAGTLTQHLGIERMGVYRLEGDRLRALRARQQPMETVQSAVQSSAQSSAEPDWTSAVDRTSGPDGLRASLGVGAQDLAHFASVPLSAPTASRDALRRHELVTVSDRQEFLETYPELARATPRVHAVAAIPLRVAGVDYGVLALSWAQDTLLGPARRRVLEAVGEQLCGTLERLDLFTEAARARTELRRHVAELTSASMSRRSRVARRDARSASSARRRASSVRS